MLSMTFLGGASSCTSQGIKWNPDFHKASSNTGGLVNERGGVVYCYEETFDDFACLHKDKISELASILSRARLPKEDREAVNKILKSLDRIKVGKH